MIAPYLLSSLVIFLEPENKSQYKLIKDQKSCRIINFLINTSTQFTLNCKMLTIRGSNISFKLDGDLLETKTNYDFNVDHSKPHDRKSNFELEKEINRNIRQKGRKSPRDESVIRLLN